MNASFEFRQCITIIKATGSTAKTLPELRLRISSVSDGSLSHHTHQYFLKDQNLEYTNDFAQWAGQSLEERELAEELSNIDPYDFRDMKTLRAELIRVIEEYQLRFPEPREARPGDFFHFNEAVTIVFPAGVWAKNLAEFLLAVKYIDRSSLYYHFYDSRLRLGDEQNDFSKWILETLNKRDLAVKLTAIDPFVNTLESIRELIVAALEEEVKRDMESAGVDHEPLASEREKVTAAAG